MSVLLWRPFLGPLHSSKCSLGRGRWGGLKRGGLFHTGAATAQQEAEAEAQALDKVKDILQKVYASLGEQFTDEEQFDGAVVRGAIKKSILQAMKS